MGEECHQCHRKYGGNLVCVSYACKIEYTERKCDDKRCLLHIEFKESSILYVFVLPDFLHDLIQYPTPVLLPGKSHWQRSLVGCSPWGREESDMTEWLHFTFHFHALEKEMATHSSVLALRIPGTGEPGGLPSMGSHRVGHDWSDLAAAGSLSERERVLGSCNYEGWQVWNL